MTKVEPTGRALKHFNVDVWITGRRRSQGDLRSTLRVLEKTKDGRIKVNPLAWWGWDMVWQYIKEHNVPFNPLLNHGYKSIGDVHSTVVVGKEAPERSGRWSGEFRTECGMHTTLVADCEIVIDSHQKSMVSSMSSFASSPIQGISEDENEEEDEAPTLRLPEHRPFQYINSMNSEDGE